MADDQRFWDKQLEGLLRGYRDPQLPADSLDEIGRRLADQLREDAVLESNLRTLLPKSEDPEIEADRLDEIGAQLAGQLAATRVSRKRRRRRGRSTGSPAWVWAGIAAAAALLIALATLTRDPAAPRATPRPSAVVRAEPEPLLQPKPAPVKEALPPRPEPSPQPAVEAPRPVIAPPRESPPPIVPGPAPVPAPAPPTVVAPPAPVAVLEVLEGDVQAPQGRGLSAGDRVVTGKDGRARVRYEDGTRLELAAESALEIGAGSGKRLMLDRGALAADVAIQPAGHPLVVATPGAEALVVGTEFTLSITGPSTRLEVSEGKVRLTRRPDGASVDVSEGHFAVAARGVALLTRPIPEERKTLVFEVEQLGSARGTRPADGPGRRIFLEPFPAAQGGWCVAVPGAGMEVVADFRLAKGTWHLWVRFRDEPGATKIGFTASVNGQALGQAATPGAGRDWIWKKFTFAWPGGAARLALRSTFEGVKAAPGQADFRQSPYGALNRWDRICLTPDESFTPE